VQQILPELGKRKNGTNAKARRVLGWQPRSNEEAIIATAKSLTGSRLVEGRAEKSSLTVEIRWRRASWR
jgi:hypothetical protein